MKKAEEIRQQILNLTKEYSREAHQKNLPAWKKNQFNDFSRGRDAVPYAGRVFDDNEVTAAVESVLDFWLTLGKEGDCFEEEFAKLLGVKKTILANSGSSANLLALSALTSHKLGDRRIRKGDEVITVAAGFPTTVTPILQNGAVPVFLDNNPYTGNIDTTLLEESYVEGKTKAVMLAHALGNPFDLSIITQFCKEKNLWLIEDNCDALGSKYLGKSGEYVSTGAWGDLSTQSFYPPHHLTLGEGGAVSIVSESRLKPIVESFRDWGRDCWCGSGCDNTCGKRYDWKMGDLPAGYDHKFIYSHLGYNLKPLDIQAAIGRQQLKKLPRFVEARKRNWAILRNGLSELEGKVEFALPTHATKWNGSGFDWDATGCRSDCSWFGFMLLIGEKSKVTRENFARHLESKKIGSRMLFGGNLVRQPAFIKALEDDSKAFRVVGKLKGADRLMKDAIFIGVYPGLSDLMLEYVIESILEFFNK